MYHSRDLLETSIYNWRIGKSKEQYHERKQKALHTRVVHKNYALRILRNNKNTNTKHKWHEIKCIIMKCIYKQFPLRLTAQHHYQTILQINNLLWQEQSTLTNERLQSTQIAYYVNWSSEQYMVKASKKACKRDFNNSLFFQ